MSRVTKRDENGMLFVDGLSWLKAMRAIVYVTSRLNKYEPSYKATHMLASCFDSDLGPVHYRLIDEEHNIWQCERCGHITQFEADGPMENGWHVCPSCVSMITPEPEDKEDEPC